MPALETELLQGMQGTPMFSAPEMVAGSLFRGCATDMWALGVTLYMALYGRAPFPARTMKEMTYHILMSPVECSPVSDAADLVDALRRMLCKEPSLRITVPQLLGHCFFMG